MAKKVKLEKYLTGGSIKNEYMTNPLQALYDDQMNKTKADATASASFLPNLLESLGPLLGQAVSSGAFGGLPTAATGGSFNTMKAINAEGGEVVESPDGDVMKLKGPSHEYGGVNLAVPGGTDIYSKRLKGPDGKTMADRKKTRVNKLKELEKKLEKNPGDTLLKKTYSRTKQAFDLADQQDLATMNAAKAEEEAMIDQGLQQPIGTEDSFATGGTVLSNLLQLLGQSQNVPDMQSLMEQSTTTPGVQPTQAIGIPETATVAQPTQSNTTEESAGKNGFNFGGLTVGDAMGFLGNLAGGIAFNKNIKDSLNNIPNVNTFKNYGEEGLQENQKVINSLRTLRDEALSDTNSRINTQRTNLRNNARGVNQMRAGDLAVTQMGEQVTNKVNSSFTNQMMQALAQRTGLLNARDQVTMSAEERKLTADQQDLAAAQDALATGRLNQASTMSRTGGLLNKIKLRNTTDSLQQELTDNIAVDQNGNIIGKGYTIPKEDANELREAGKLEEFDTAKNLGYDVYSKYGKIYYSGSSIEYDPSNPDPDFLTVDTNEDSIEDNFEGSGFDTLEFEDASPDTYLDYTDGSLTGNTLYSGLEMDNVSNILGSAAQEYGKEVNLDNPDSVKEFQSWLGLSDKDLDGKVGNTTLDKVLSKVFPNMNNVKSTDISSSTPVPAKKYFQGVTKTEVNNVKNRLKSTESSGGKDLRTSSAGAKGSYQIIWSYHKDNIKRALGNVTESQFNSSPKLQEEYMDYAVQQYAKRITPEVQKSVNNVFPNMSKEDMLMLYHYEPSIINGIADGRITSLNHVPGTTDHVNKTIGYYLYGTNRPKGVIRTGKGIRKGKNKNKKQ